MGKKRSRVPGSKREASVGELAGIVSYSYVLTVEHMGLDLPPGMAERVEEWKLAHPQQAAETKAVFDEDPDHFVQLLMDDMAGV